MVLDSKQTLFASYRWNIKHLCRIRILLQSRFEPGEVTMTQEINCPLKNEECAVCLAQHSAQITRRSFFASMLGACAGLIATVIGAPILRYILYPVLAGARTDKWTEVGDVTEFEKLEAPVTKTISLVQRDGWREVVSDQPVFISRVEQWNAPGSVAHLSPSRMLRSVA